MVSPLHAHRAFVTKYRRGVPGTGMLQCCEDTMRKVCAGFGAELLDSCGSSTAKPATSPAGQLPAQGRAVEAREQPQGVSSRRMRHEFPDLARHYWQANRLWSASYFAGSAGGAPIPVLRQYIEQPDQPI
jgi:putative transposase